MPKRPVAAEGTSVWQRRPGGRQQPLAITREQITDAAIAQADAEGLDTVTMRRLGATLGIAPTSLYWYFSTKAELHELMADASIGQIPLAPTPSGNWRADIEAMAWATLTVARRHPWFTQLFFQKIPGPATMAYGATALRSFALESLEPVVALNYLAAVNNYVLGFAQREAQQGDSPTHRGDTVLPPDGPVPAEQVIARTTLTTDDSFACGLECLLDGIQNRIGR